VVAAPVVVVDSAVKAAVAVGPGNGASRAGNRFLR
jgi:hypothetical protein